MLRLNILGLLLGFLTACTYNISLVHTEGQADNVVDETSTNTPRVAPTLNFPMGPH